MSKLNEYNNITKKKIHIMVTSLCNRNCKYCCNKQYDINSVPYVTDAELKEGEVIYITGGEPFSYVQPERIAEYYRKKYPNIKKVYCYTNAVELEEYINRYGEQNLDFTFFEGLSISIKNKADVVAFNKIKDITIIKNLNSNWVYVFNNLYPMKDIEGFTMVERVWQKDFNAYPNSIFRRG